MDGEGATSEANLTVLTNASVLNTAVLYFKEPPWLEVVRLVVEVSIALLGIIGNVLVCHVITNNTKLHTVVNFHIRNLAVADIGVLMINFPLAAIKEQDPTDWPLGEFFCRYLYPVCDVFHGVSVWSITAIAVDRYRAIVVGEMRDRKKALKSARIVVVLIWVISFFIVSVPLFFVMNFIDYRPQFDVIDCTPKWPDQYEENALSQAYMIGIALFWYIIPLSVIVWTYIKIAKRLRESSKFHKTIRRTTSSRRSQRHRERQNSKAQKLLTPVVVVFTVMMFPLNSLRLAITYWSDLGADRFVWVYYNVAVLCIIVNSSVNCLIYALVSKEFRRGLLTKCCGAKQRFVEILTSTTPSNTHTALTTYGNRHDMRTASARAGETKL